MWVLCQGELLEEVTERNLFNKSKDFTDMALKFEPYKILDAYHRLPKNRTDDVLIKFLNSHFESHGSDFQDCTFTNMPDLPPTDFYDGKKNWPLHRVFFTTQNIQ